MCRCHVAIFEWNNSKTCAFRTERVCSSLCLSGAHRKRARFCAQKKQTIREKERGTIQVEDQI